MTIKQKIYNHCLELVNDRIKMLRNVLADLKESGTNETKSTAGDKHETALAMLQIEQSNTREQLTDALAKKAMLEKIDPLRATVKVTNGSLVKTDRGYLFISIALGKIRVDDNPVIALSPQSPLGSKLIGTSSNLSVEINNNKYVIESFD